MKDWLVEIIPDLFLVVGEREGRFPFAHGVLVQGERRALIDTGVGIERLRRLREQFPPDLVIASHSHPDHTAGDWLFEGIPLYAPQQAADTLGRLKPLSQRFFPDADGVAATWRGFVRKVMNFGDAPATHTYRDGDVFDFGGEQSDIKLVAIHTPGHAADHFCFFEPTHGVLLSADIDLTSFGPWYGHHECDIEQFKASIRRVMALKPKVVVSSHKGIIREEIQERLARFLAAFDEREAKIRDLLAAGHTVMEMVDLSPFYGGHKYAAELMRYWEEQMIRKHLKSCLDNPSLQSTIMPE